jgi:hypothetical protein
MTSVETGSPRDASEVAFRRPTLRDIPGEPD